MTQRFQDKVAIVTGASSGIGRATAVGLAREGAKVTICADRNVEGLEETRQELAALGAECLALQVDVRSQAAVEGCVQQTREHFGTIDILVNNAGTGQFSPFPMMSNDEYDRVMDINLRGTFYFCRAVLPIMLEHDYGKIVNVTSIMGEIAAMGQSIYNASKGAAKLMTQGIAVDVAGRNINVNAVAPGMVVTNMTQRMFGDKERERYFVERIPKRRIGQPEDIAGPILFLCSDEASYIHGTTLVVDGGMLCTR
ncbi:SDR family oxidoreductase [Candidatus Chloroploca sp. M-50]|uniref:SDR family oxidoreductase n=1 Tax=Candidatus Chloroploca mongolica TaxID=2528176 RepID=A0ABS4DDM7_9CHLR|nr:SDR family NAD(P)-dependent oxidoreductase [Candidatus Chloroploca mongolica]MBP1467557.1 SDR family oxidoreductase [Candidatus Chloroploca mongolica]